MEFEDNYDDMTSKVYSCTDTRDKQYELTTRMKQLATDYMELTDQGFRATDTADDLAKTVLEFLKVSGWTRS